MYTETTAFSFFPGLSCARGFCFGPCYPSCCSGSVRRISGSSGGPALFVPLSGRPPRSLVLLGVMVHSVLANQCTPKRPLLVSFQGSVALGDFVSGLATPLVVRVQFDGFLVVLEGQLFLSRFQEGLPDHSSSWESWFIPSWRTNVHRNDRF